MGRIHRESCCWLLGKPGDRDTAPWSYSATRETRAPRFESEMACYAYHKVQGQVGDCFAFVEKADGWFDQSFPLKNSLDTWLTWSFVALIVTHCLMVVLLSNSLVQGPSSALPFWGHGT